MTAIPTAVPAINPQIPVAAARIACFCGSGAWAKTWNGPPPATTSESVVLTLSSSPIGAVLSPSPPRLKASLLSPTSSPAVEATSSPTSAVAPNSRSGSPVGSSDSKSAMDGNRAMLSFQLSGLRSGSSNVGGLASSSAPSYSAALCPKVSSRSSGLIKKVGGSTPLELPLAEYLSLYPSLGSIVTSSSLLARSGPSSPERSIENIEGSSPLISIAG